MFAHGYLFLISLILYRAPYPSGFMAWEDADVYFNHWNNIVRQESILYYYEGYIPIYAEVTAYSASGLGFVTQSVVYMLVAVTLGVFLLFEIAMALRDLSHSRVGAVGLAAFVVAYLHFVCPNLYINLSYSIWPALIGAAVYSYRVFILGQRPTVWETLLAFTGSASHPLSLATVPVLVVGLVAGRENVRRSALVAGILALGAGLGVMSALGHNDHHTLAEYRAAFIELVTHMLTRGPISALKTELPILIMAAAMAVTVRDLWRVSRGKPAPLAFPRLIATYFVVAFAAMFFLSDRFLWYKLMPDRYLTPSLTFAFIGLASTSPIHGLITRWQRSIVLKSTQVVAVLALAIVGGLSFAILQFHALYAPRIAFLMSAQCVRDQTLHDITIVAEPAPNGFGSRHVLTVLGTPLPHRNSETEYAVFKASSGDRAAAHIACRQLRDSQTDPNLEGDIFFGTPFSTSNTSRSSRPMTR